MFERLKREHGVHDRRHPQRYKDSGAAPGPGRRRTQDADTLTLQPNALGLNVDTGSV